MRMIRHALEEVGFGTVGSSDPAEGLALARRVQADLFILDLGWREGKTDGFRLLKELRAIGYVETPAIGISANGEWVRAALESGDFAGGIVKPFDLDDLVSTVQRVTGWPPA